MTPYLDGIATVDEIYFPTNSGNGQSAPTVSTSVLIVAHAGRRSLLYLA